MNKLILIFLLLESPALFSQNPTDSIIHKLDSGYYYTVNRAKNRFWGNSTYLSSSLNFTNGREFDIAIGRTYGKALYGPGGLGYYVMKSWGIGYSKVWLADSNVDNIKAFYEFNFYPFVIIGNLTLRGEHIYSPKDNQNYLRPYIGMTFVFVDIAYNYSFLLNEGQKNIYKHGICVRLKFFLKRKNWERKFYHYKGGY